LIKGNKVASVPPQGGRKNIPQQEFLASDTSKSISVAVLFQGLDKVIERRAAQRHR